MFDIKQESRMSEECKILYNILRTLEDISKKLDKQEEPKPIVAINNKPKR